VQFKGLDEVLSLFVVIGLRAISNDKNIQTFLLDPSLSRLQVLSDTAIEPGKSPLAMIRDLRCYSAAKFRDAKMTRLALNDVSLARTCDAIGVFQTSHDCDGSDASVGQRATKRKFPLSPPLSGENERIKQPATIVAADQRTNSKRKIPSDQGG